MPLYDYRCTACDQTFELLLRASATPVCPACGGERLERLVSRPAPQGKSAGLAAKARAKAAREGHFSHYSAAEKPRG